MGTTGATHTCPVVWYLLAAPGMAPGYKELCKTRNKMVIFPSDFLPLHLVWVRNSRKEKGKWGKQRKVIGKDTENTHTLDFAYVETRRKTII